MPPRAKGKANRRQAQENRESQRSEPNEAARLEFDNEGPSRSQARGRHMRRGGSEDGDDPVFQLEQADEQRARPPIRARDEDMAQVSLESKFVYQMYWQE